MYKSATNLPKLMRNNAWSTKHWSST